MRILRKIVLVSLSLLLTSCGFVNYVEHTSIEQSFVDELLDKRDSFVSKLEQSYAEKNYYDNERKTFVRAMVEAKSELFECNEIDKLQSIYEKHNDIIKNIKTKDNYAEELANKKDEYIEKITSVCNETIYREYENKLYDFYIEKAISAFKEFTSINDDFEKLYLIYKDIIEAIKTDADYEKEEKEAFQKYKENAEDEITDYIDLDAYRKEEADEIKIILSNAIADIEEATTYDEIDIIVRNYKINVYHFETDEELYNKELLLLVDETKDEASNYLNKNEYRSNEINIIDALIESFGKEVGSLTKKEEVLELLDTYKMIFDSIKTDKQLYEEEKLLLAETLYFQLKEIVRYDSLATEEKTYYDSFYAALKLLSTKEDVESAYNEEKYKQYKHDAQHGDQDALIQYQLFLVNNLNYYLDKSLYREAQQQEIDSIINNCYGLVLNCSTYDDTIATIDDVKVQLEDVLTNEELWEIEDAEFFDKLADLYGDNVLIPKGSLVEANNYFELANIIDYYAFYQLDSNSFVRDTFRVKLNWNHKDATFEKREVYWYCELVCHAVGLDVYFEDNDYLVIKLIPYDLSSINVSGSLSKRDNVVGYHLDNELLDRDSEFDDFKYKELFTNSVVCWNTQQLWYALEQGYIPLCVPGSKAEEVFNQAKSILRTIIKEGMSDIQKIFEIYKWCGMNWHHDYSFFDYWETSDLDEYPDEGYSLVSSAFAEGALLTNSVVCCGAAKGFLILLRIEGIEALRIIGEHSEMAKYNTINGKSFGTSGTHEVVFIHLGDTWYYSDPLGAAIEFNNTVSFMRLFVSDTKIPWPNKMYNELRDSSPLDVSLFTNIVYDFHSIYVTNDEELFALVDSFVANPLNVGKCLNVLYDPKVYDAFAVYKQNYSYDYMRSSWQISEFCIYL